MRHCVVAARKDILFQSPCIARTSRKSTSSRAGSGPMRIGVTRVLAFIPSVLMNRRSPIRLAVQMLKPGRRQFPVQDVQALPED
jgi:hypothetical protein